jgi:phosphoribosylamine--glycine ligase
MATTTQLPNAQAVWAKTQFDGSATRVALGGRWTLANASMLETAMQSLDTKGAELLHIDLAAVDAIDWPGGFCRRDIGWRAL